MKKNVISLAVATSVAALGATAVQSAMYLNPEKTGEVLLFPFYDAENGNATNFHVVNTTKDAKAVKIRFREYKASYEVLDFNLYLSAEDHFAFGVIMDPNGTGGAVITNDNSCTVPALGTPNNGFDGTTTENADGSVTRIQPFVDFEFLKQVRPFADSDIERTLRGHVEVIEMGVVANGSTDPKSGLLHKSYLTHGPDGVPANCDGLLKSWSGATPGGWKGDTDLGISNPTGGLYGIAYHINVEDAAAWGFEPAAIDEFWDNGGNDGFHATPGGLLPNLGNGTEEALIPSNGAYITYTKNLLTRPSEDPVSALFMTKSVTNDVMLNATIGGQTDWVTTFPTKYAYVNDKTAATVVKPFTDFYAGQRLNLAETAYIEYLACEPLVPTYLDREEATTIGGNDFSPAPPDADGIVICDETNVTAWGASLDSALNVERDLRSLSFPYTEGWARWSFNDADQVLPGDINGSQGALEGLPAMGFAAYAYANGSMGGVLMNYGHASEHKTDVVCSGASCPADPDA